MTKFKTALRLLREVMLLDEFGHLAPPYQSAEEIRAFLKRYDK